nr:unnamed protein product [Naegleria fowleri]
MSLPICSCLFPKQRCFSKSILRKLCAQITLQSTRCFSFSQSSLELAANGSFELNNDIEDLNHQNVSIIDERPVSLSERSYLTPSMKEYGNGLVWRVLRFKIVPSTHSDSIFQPSIWKNTFHLLLKEALKRIQKSQPLLRSKIISSDEEKGKSSSNEGGSSTGFKFVMLDDDHVPEIPFYEIQFDRHEYSSLRDYLEKYLLQKRFDLEKNFQLEVYYHADDDELSLMFCYNHCIGDGLSLSNFIGAVLKECENIWQNTHSNSANRNSGHHSCRKLLPSSDQIILQSNYNSFINKMKALMYGIPWVFKTLTTRINQTLVDESLEDFSKLHALSQNSLLISLLSHAYLRAACQYYLNEHSQQKPFSNTLRIGYPVGLSLLPGLQSVLDGSKLTVHVGTMMRDVTITPNVACMNMTMTDRKQDINNREQENLLLSSIIDIAKDIKENHTKHFINQFTLINIMTSATNREKAILKSLETSDIHFGGIPLNFILTNNGNLDNVMKRCYQFSDSFSLLMESIQTVANTSALASALACGTLTLPADDSHNKEAQLMLSLSGVEPIISRDKLLAIQKELENLIECIVQGH